MWFIVLEDQLHLLLEPVTTLSTESVSLHTVLKYQETLNNFYVFSKYAFHLNKLNPETLHVHREV